MTEHGPTDYARNRVAGNTFFCTVRLSDPHSALLTEHIAAFGEAMRKARSRKPFHVDAWIALPGHAHTIWTLPPGDQDCASRWRVVKIAFSKSLRKMGGPPVHGIWERHFRQHAIASAQQYGCLVDHVHGDAVRHGLCMHPEEWPWSSLHRFIAAGWQLPA